MIDPIDYNELMEDASEVTPEMVANADAEQEMLDNEPTKEEWDAWNGYEPGYDFEG